MNLTYKNKKLYMLVSPEERQNCLPFIYGVKLDTISGLWVASVGALLTIITIFPVIKPTDKTTKALLNDATNLINAMKEQKDLINKKQTVTNSDYPFLMSHQAVCVNIADIRPRYAFFLDTGTR